MSFERFTGPDVSWDDAPAIASPVIAAGADMRIAEVHAALEWLEQQRRPDAFSEKQWHILLKDMHMVADQWLDLAFVCGWSINDLFASPPIGSRRLDMTGAALVLAGRPIDSIDSDRIVIGNRMGPPNTLYRQPPGSSVAFGRSRSKPIWEAIHEAQS